MAKTLIDAFVDGISGYKRYLMGRFTSISEYDAEDIIQQTAMKFIYNGRDIQTIDRIRAYIYRSLSNAAKDYFKKESREVPVESFETEGTDTTESQLLKIETKRLIKQAIYKLDKKSQFIFVETVLKGRSYKDLSEQTGEPIGTLLSRKNRAVKKVKAYMEDYMKA